MKKLLISLIFILATSLVFVSCDKDDETRTFFEKYEGTVWFNQDDYTEYIRILDNLNTPFEDWSWSSFSECYYYYIVEVVDDGYEITKNNEYSFVLTLSEVDEGVEYNFEVIITINGNSLIMDTEYRMDGILVESYSKSYTKSNEDVDSFILCN